MNYPVAYRKQSYPHRTSPPRRGSKAFKPSRPVQPRRKPAYSRPRATPKQRAQARALARLSRAGKVIARRIPYLGWALLAWDLWRWYNGQNAHGMSPFSVPGGMVLQHDCGAGPITHYNYIAGGSGPWVSIPCFNASTDTGARDITQPFPLNIGKLRLQHHSATVLGVRRFTARQYWYRSTTQSNVGWQITRPILRDPRQGNVPLGRPIVLDPMNLPIKWPMPYPEPVPHPIAPKRLDHPMIRQTGNSVERPGRRPIPRRPPRDPKKEKEVKLAARGGVMRAILSIQKIGHATTEALDALDALHSALPKQYRARPVYVEGLGWRKASPQAKAKALWENVEHIDWEKAAVELAQNQIEDAILGRANAGADRALNNSPIGRINRGIAF